MITLSFCTAPATTEIYTLSLHDALPISRCPTRTRASAAARRYKHRSPDQSPPSRRRRSFSARPPRPTRAARSEEHTSELQSRLHLVCRLLLEKKNPEHKTKCHCEIEITP